MTEQTRTAIERRVEQARERIAAACERAGRDPDAVTLVAVTKTHPVETVRSVLAAGVRDIGENRVQELEEKVAEVGREAARWHLIGHLQRNKASRAAPLFDLIHSLDSLRLARKLSDPGAAEPVRALVQVNTSGEASKFGLAEEQALDVIGEMAELPGLRLLGVMTMAPHTDDQRVLRRTFAGARRIAEEAARQVPGFAAEQLSMGMSNDFEVAVEEGSTLVRLGSVLFGERDYD